MIIQPKNYLCTIKSASIMSWIFFAICVLVFVRIINKSHVGNSQSSYLTNDRYSDYDDDYDYDYDDDDDDDDDYDYDDDDDDVAVSFVAIRFKDKKAIERAKKFKKNEELFFVVEENNAKTGDTALRVVTNDDVFIGYVESDILWYLLKMIKENKKCQLFVKSVDYQDNEYDINVNLSINDDYYTYPTVDGADLP